jgi:hypothetical protein
MLLGGNPGVQLCGRTRTIYRSWSSRVTTPKRCPEVRSHVQSVQTRRRDRKLRWFGSSTIQPSPTAKTRSSTTSRAWRRSIRASAFTSSASSLKATSSSCIAIRNGRATRIGHRYLSPRRRQDCRALGCAATSARPGCERQHHVLTRSAQPDRQRCPTEATKSWRGRWSAIGDGAFRRASGVEQDER